MASSKTSHASPEQNQIFAVQDVKSRASSLLKLRIQLRPQDNGHSKMIQPLLSLENIPLQHDCSAVGGLLVVQREYKRCVYYCIDGDTPRKISALVGSEEEIIHQNRRRFPKLSPNTMFKAFTPIVLPLDSDQNVDGLYDPTKHSDFSFDIESQQRRLQQVKMQREESRMRQLIHDDSYHDEPLLPVDDLPNQSLPGGIPGVILLQGERRVYFCFEDDGPLQISKMTDVSLERIIKHNSRIYGKLTQKTRFHALTPIVLPLERYLEN